jgi:hypothetical protein
MLLHHNKNNIDAVDATRNGGLGRRCATETPSIASGAGEDVTLQKPIPLPARSLRSGKQLSAFAITT